MSSAEFGKKLRRARLDRKKRFPDLQAETKIQAEYLRKLEDGQFDFFPEPIIIGFIKSYAQALELNPESLLKLYEQARSQTPGAPKKREIKRDKESEPAKPEVKVEGEAPETSTTKPLFSRSRKPKIKAYGQTPDVPARRYDDPDKDDESPAPPTAVTPINRDRGSGWLESHRGEVALGSMALVIVLAIVFVYVRYSGDSAAEPPQPVEKISVFEARQQNIDSAATEKPEIEPIRLPEQVKLRVVAAETTWVRLIRDAVDTSEYIFRPGADRSFEADSLIEVRLGRADGLIFWVNSDSLGKMGTAAEIVSRLVITEQGITERRVRPPIPQTTQ